MGNIYKNNIRSKNFKIILSIIIIAIICIIAIFQLLHTSDKKEEDKVRYTEKRLNDKIKQIDEERTAYLGEVFENVNLNIESEELNLVINNLEKSSDDIFGKTTEKVLEENSFPERHIRTRDSFGRLNYVVFTKLYNKPLFNNLYLTDSKSEIERKLNINIKEGREAITIRNKGYYVHINIAMKEAVVMPIIEDANIDEFLKITKSFLKDGDLKKYVPEITTKYPYYTNYEYGENKIHLTYPTLGIDIIFLDKKANRYGESGINVYPNSPFYGRIRDFKNENDKEDIIKMREYDLVKTEGTRILMDVAAKKDSLLKSPNYQVGVYANKTKNENSREMYNNILVFSSKYNFGEPYNLNTSGVADSIVVTDKYVYYGIDGEGIYRHNPEDKENLLIEKITDEVRLKNIKGNKLYVNEGYIELR
ncbi:MAG: hypothetical protein HG467_002855 [Clostridiales bacterium]|nr:hypothetical protein [Clostridiales bacterium]